MHQHHVLFFMAIFIAISVPIIDFVKGLDKTHALIGMSVGGLIYTVWLATDLIIKAIKESKK